VNRVVPLIYPKLAAKFGDQVLYIQSPARHIMVEFSFDVLQVGLGAYTLQSYRDFIGFHVAKELLARAFRETYALDLAKLFVNEDLAIGTYRKAVSTTIPEMTRLAWEDKQDEIRERLPGIERSRFVFPQLTRQEYERAYGVEYKKPGLLSRVVYFVAKLIPKVGPFRPLAFEPLTPETARLMDASFVAARNDYRALLQSLASKHLNVANTDLDTGKPPMRVYNPLVEKTYAELVDKLADQRFAGVSTALRAALLSHYNSPMTGGRVSRKERKMDVKARRQLEPLDRAAAVK
jgi:hypothetical protein